MARTLSAQTAAQATQPKPNSINLEATIATAYRAIHAKKQDIAAEMEAHVEPLKEDLSRLWRSLKKDTGLNRKDLELLYKLYEREQEAQDLDDEAEREKIQDGLRAGYRALKTGEMVNFPDVVEAQSNGADATSSAKRTIQVKEAKTAGRQAGLAGAHADKNPHAKGTDEHAAWEEGRCEGQDDIAKDLGRGPVAGKA